METVTIGIDCRERIQLLKAQQGELDSIVFYRRLADLVEDKECSKKLFKIASNEGRHAAILRRYTGEVLRANEGKALAIVILYKIFGLKFVLKVLSRGELRASKRYSLFMEEFPNVQEIIEDKISHEKLMRAMIS